MSSFRGLPGEELAKVADFFAVDVEAADAEKGATKKELLAALAAGEEPVTWEQYETMYLPVAKEQEAKEQAAKEALEAAQAAQAAAPAPVEKEPEDEPIILKMERENARFDIRGYTFTKQHPYLPVTEAAAEYILENVEGFRQARPSEVKEYYS